MGRSEYTIEVKALADSSEGGFLGDLSVYGNVDDVGDIVERGAFDDSLRVKTHYPLLWQHDMTEPIGSFDVVSSDGDALKIDGKFNLQTQRGREAYALLKANDINGLSIGYTVDDYKYDESGIRHLQKITLHEGSLVSFPANRLATAQAKQMVTRLQNMEQKSRYASLKFLAKLSEEDRLELLEELEELDKSSKAEEEPDVPKEEDEEKPVEDEKADDEVVEDDQDILDALKECAEEIDKLKE